MKKPRPRVLISGIMIIGIFATRSLWNEYSIQQPDQVPRSPASLNTGSLGGRAYDSCRSIYQTVCQKKGVTYDPTGSVHPDVDGEREAVDLYKKVIREYQEKYKDASHTEEEKFDIINENLVQRIFSPKRRGRIVSAFQWVRHAMEVFFDRQPTTVFTAMEKEQIKNRIRKTQLELPPPAKVYADEFDLFTKNEIYYERISSEIMRLRVGGAYVFVAKSWFNLIFTLAHELGHAIDPCEVRAMRLSFPAYDHLSACFLQSGLIATHKTRVECG